MANVDKSMHARLSAYISNRYHLTRRENEILLGLIGQGMSNKELSDKLFISEKTMKNHMANIFQKLNIHSSRQILPLLLEEAVQYMKMEAASTNFWQKVVPIREKDGREERVAYRATQVRSL